MPDNVTVRNFALNRSVSAPVCTKAAIDDHCLQAFFITAPDHTPTYTTTNGGKFNIDNSITSQLNADRQLHHYHDNN